MVIDLTKQKQRIETRMVKVVAEMSRAVDRVEEMMLIGYKSRERAIEQNKLI